MQRHLTFARMIADWNLRGVIATVEFKTDNVWLAGAQAPHDREGVTRFKSQLVAHLRATGAIENANGDLMEVQPLQRPLISPSSVAHTANVQSGVRWEAARKRNLVASVERANRRKREEAEERWRAVDFSLPDATNAKLMNCNISTVGKRRRKAAQMTKDAPGTLNGASRGAEGPETGAVA